MATVSAAPWQIDTGHQPATALTPGLPPPMAQPKSADKTTGAWREPKREDSEEEEEEDDESGSDLDQAWAKAADDLMNEYGGDDESDLVGYIPKQNRNTKKTRKK